MSLINNLEKNVTNNINNLLSCSTNKACPHFIFAKTACWTTTSNNRPSGERGQSSNHSNPTFDIQPKVTKFTVIHIGLFLINSPWTWIASLAAWVSSLAGFSIRISEQITLHQMASSTKFHSYISIIALAIYFILNELFLWAFPKN